MEVLFQETAAALQQGPFRLLPGDGSHHYAIVQRALVDARVQGPEGCLGREIASSGPEADAHALAHQATRAVLDAHDVNRVRRDLGENGADMLWLWGPGDEAVLSAPDEALSVVSADPWWAGAARAAGMRLREPQEATSEGVVAAVAQSLADGDAVCTLHVRGATAAALQKDLRARTRALADIDEQLVGPLAELAASRRGRLLVVPDTARETATGHPLADPVPALLWGAGVAAVAAHPFTERGAFEAGRPLEPGHGVVAYVRNL
jgi:2,3-bisphosphoglycerate-independent phosphoglycerate mutase